MLLKTLNYTKEAAGLYVAFPSYFSNFQAAFATIQHSTSQCAVYKVRNTNLQCLCERFGVPPSAFDSVGRAKKVNYHHHSMNCAIHLLNNDIILQCMQSFISGPQTVAEEAHRAGEPGAASRRSGLHTSLPHGPDEPTHDGGVQHSADAGTVFAKCIGGCIKIYENHYNTFVSLWRLVRLVF